MRHLVLKNLKGRKACNSIIISAVALAVTMVFAALFMTTGVQEELERARTLQEPDLAVVPRGTKAAGHISLAQGPPQGVLPAGALEQMRAFAGIEAVTSQKLMGSVLTGGVKTALISFEPATDFVVTPWLEKKDSQKFQGGSGEIILGALVEVKKAPGDLLEVNGGKFTISGRLKETTSFRDSAIFFPSAGAIAEPSWALLRLRQDTYMDAMSNRLDANIPQIEVIARPELLKTINDQLYGLIQGGSLNIAALLMAVGVLLFAGAMFALVIYERKKEFGLLKAMGARNTFVFRLVIGEAFALGVTGGGLGVVLSMALLALAPAGFAFGELSALSLIGFIVPKLLLALSLTIAVCIFTALYPALLAARLEPYAAIRSGE
jgi:putative ABC transport system permease protein